jgi:hypothetical protein
MGHSVARIEGELWTFICENPNLGAYKIIEKYSDLGKTIINKDFGKKKYIELIGVTELEAWALEGIESIYNEVYPRQLLSFQQY